MAHFALEFYAKSLARKVSVDLVIPSLNLGGCLGNADPDYYCNKKETYPLVICLCGFGDNKEAWQRNTAIIDQAEKNGFACCFVNGENKWYHNMGQIDDHYAFLERDLPDFLYGNFRNLSKKKPLIIAGVSMGGYGALYHYLKNKDKYAACIALSPATKPDQLDESQFGSLRDLFLETKGIKNNIYLSVGSADFIIKASEELDSFLAEHKIDVSYKYVPGCDHSWPTWAKEVPCIVNYFRNHGFIGELPTYRKR